MLSKPLKSIISSSSPQKKKYLKNCSLTNKPHLRYLWNNFTWGPIWFAVCDTAAKTAESLVEPWSRVILRQQRDFSWMFQLENWLGAGELAVDVLGPEVATCKQRWPKGPSISSTSGRCCYPISLALLPSCCGRHCVVQWYAIVSVISLKGWELILPQKQGNLSVQPSSWMLCPRKRRTGGPGTKWGPACDMFLSLVASSATK